MPREHSPLIGVSGDLTRLTTPSGQERTRLEVSHRYLEAIARAGGVPVVLSPIAEQIDEQLTHCMAVVLTGGDDPRTEPFGTPTHPAAAVMHPERQAYETALLRALLHGTHRDVPVLTICLGMQLSALVAGGSLDQHLPDSLGEVAAMLHRHDARHTIVPTPDAPAWLTAACTGDACVTSHHRQAVASPGSLRVIARSSTETGAVIEAVDDPRRPGWFLGTQWHPERTVDPGLGSGLFNSLIQHARRRPADPRSIRAAT